MVRSMTGFGRQEAVLDGYGIAVELKSVNHRYFEFSSRISRGYGFLDEKLKSYLQSRISRGKVDAFVSVEPLESGAVQVSVNHSLAQGYVLALRELSQRYGLNGEISAVKLSRFPDVLTVRKACEDEDKVWALVERVAQDALASLLHMREAEGARLKEDVLNRAHTILGLVARIEERSPKTVKEYQQKLQERLSELLEEAGVDEQRILMEAAVYADKTAVAEETVRLRSHFDQLVQMLEGGGPTGRKLDFLIQEMNREANTIGSKATDTQIAYWVVDIKAEIEKIREQIQNME